MLDKFSFWAVVAYLVPGLLLLQARALGARSRFEAITKENLVAYVLVTVIYDLISWANGFAIQTDMSVSSLEPATLIRHSIVVPIIIGFVYGLAERYWIPQRLLVPLGINAPLPTESVWLEIFSRQPVGTYLIVTLKDGAFFNAMVTHDSRFSSSPVSPDIYLGQTYSSVDWTPANPQRGVYIAGDEIRSIEIISAP